MALVFQTEDTSAIAMLNHVLRVRYNAVTEPLPDNNHSVIIHEESFPDVSRLAGDFGLAISYGEVLRDHAWSEHDILRM